MSQKIEDVRMECGCFGCLEIFAASDVIDWIDDGETPLCPHCGMDAVLPGVTDLVRLLRLHERRFGLTRTELPEEDV